MARELTKKQRGFIADIIKTGNATKSALNNYDIESKDKENVAGAIGSENLTKPKIRRELKPFIDKLILHRNRILKRMDKTINKAEYAELSNSLDKVVKNIQLLSGGKTENNEMTIKWE